MPVVTHMCGRSLRRARMPHMHRGFSVPVLWTRLHVETCLAHEPKRILNRLQHGPLVVCPQDAIPPDEVNDFMIATSLLTASIGSPTVGSCALPFRPSPRNSIEAKAMPKVL